MSEQAAQAQPAIIRQFVNFGFFKLNQEWRKLDAQTREQGKQAFLQAFQKFGTKIILRSYSLLGVRADSEIMFWRISERLDDFYEMSSELAQTGFGQYLVPVYSYLSMTKRSMYMDRISPEHVESRTRVVPGKYKYIFVYPFVKTRDWYLLSLEQRQLAMDEHIRIGTKYPSVKLNTTYSFGLDDQDFVVAFESDQPSDFLDLVMELRESQASKYTVRDTPTFTCMAKPIEELLKAY